MKLTKTTLNLIKNFASINTNLLIRPGNQLMTFAPNQSIYGECTVEETFPVQMGIYDLSEFLSIMSIFTDPDLEFSERHLTITEGKNRIRYMPADPEVLIYPKRSPRDLVDKVAQFDLSGQALTQITRVASAIKAGFLTISGNNGIISLLVHDKENVNSNQFKLDVGETSATFEFHIKVELLKMVPENYSVSVSSGKLCKFVGTDKYYIVTCEDDSTYTPE